MNITDEMVEAAARVFYASQTGGDKLLTSFYAPQWLGIARRALEAALTEDDAEWEYAVRDRTGRIWFTGTAGAIDGDTAVRRRKAGPWDPVEP